MGSGIPMAGKLFPPGTPLEPYPPPPLLPEKVVPGPAQPGKIYLSTGEKQLFGIFFLKKHHVTHESCARQAARGTARVQK